MKLNQILRAQILDEHGRIYLQTITDERKKLYEEVETFKSLRLASHEIVKKMCYELFGDQDLATLRKFGLTTTRHRFNAETTFDIEQDEDTYVDGVKHTTKVKKPYYHNWKNHPISFELEAIHIACLYFDEFMKDNHNPFYICSWEDTGMFDKNRTYYKKHHEVHRYAMHGTKFPERDSYNYDINENPFALEIPDAKNDKLRFKIRTKKENDTLCEFQTQKNIMYQALRKYCKKYYEVQTIMREYLKTCKTTDDVKKVWEDFNPSILKTEMGTSVGQNIMTMMTQLKSFHSDRLANV